MYSYEAILKVLNDDDPLYIYVDRGLTGDGYINEARIIANVMEVKAGYGDPIGGEDIAYVFGEFFFPGCISNERADLIASKLRHPSSGVYAI